MFLGSLFPAVKAKASSLAYGAGGPVVLGLLGLLPAGQMDPADALLKSFEMHRRQPLEMIQIQQPYFEESPVVVKVVVDGRRRMRVDVLRPLNHEGVASVDDGKELRIFYPDKDEIFVQRSPMLFQTEPAERVRLIEANYDLDMRRGPKVAGRSTQALTLEARHDGISDRVIFLDNTTLFPLRMEAKSEGGERVLTDTLSIRFDAGKPPPSFTLAGTDTTRIIRQWGPEQARHTRDEAKRLGFQPEMPARLPFGFRVQAAQLLGSQDKPFLAVRISDGLLSSTLYMWSRSVHGSRNPVGRDPIFTKDGSLFTVYGDAPQGLSRTLLSTFVLAQK